MPDTENLPFFDQKPATLPENLNESNILCNLENDTNNEKFIKKLLKKLKTAKGMEKDGGNGFSNFLDHYY